jgi:hypothetical protein
MAGLVPNALRDELISSFREAVGLQYGCVPFAHQREVFAASDGLLLEDTPDPDGLSLMIPSLAVLPNDLVEDEVVINGFPWAIVRRGTCTRPNGRAKILADLGSFKIGKSFGAALWASGFAAVPGARVSLVGHEYDMCEPEFNYLVEFLLSERGMNLKATSLQNRPRDGKMWMDLPNGARYEAKSWERKDSLKGKEIDAYLYCEAYQLPGIECFTDFSQNLRVRQGYAYFATTPDRPWVKILHEAGHGANPETLDWHCTCSVGAEVNPYSFDQKAKDRDKTLMTREKFAIHYEGRMGDFVGKVYPYQVGEKEFNAGTHPDLFRAGVTSPLTLSIPQHWDVVGGADTGTFYSSVCVAFDPDGNAFVIGEYPNYTYVGQKPDRDESVTIPGWAREVSRGFQRHGGRLGLWADPNTQFKGELLNYGITLLPQRVPVETRTEIAREYFQHNRIFLAPWLKVLPFELENAEWPAEASATGSFKRVKDRDHTLDCLEHILARRPYGRTVNDVKAPSWAESQGWKRKSRTGNTHLGAQ